LRIPLGELADIYGRQRAQGRLFAQDLNQFTGRGVPLIQELAKQFGVAEMEVRKLVEQGKVGFENLEEAVISLTSEGGQFHDLMKAQSKTMSGLATTLKDEVNLALTEIGTTISEDLQFRDLTEELLVWSKAFRTDVLPVFKFGLGEIGAQIKFLQGGAVEFLRRWGQITGNDVLVSQIENSKMIAAGQLPDPAQNQGGATHDPLAQDFAAELVRLEQRRDALGKSRVEVELMELASSKYTEEQKQSLRGALEEIAAKQKLLDLEDERKRVAQDAAREQHEAARRLGKFMGDLVLDAVKKAKQEAQELQDIATRITDKVNPGVKLGQELFGVQRALDAGLINNEEAKLFSDDLMKEFGGRFKQQAPSRTAGAALERGSAEAFSAIMRSMDRDKKDELPKIAKDHLQVAQQTLEQLRQGAANPVQVVENAF
jgi:tape measure domain-containing protein